MGLSGFGRSRAHRDKPDIAQFLVRALALGKRRAAIGGTAGAKPGPPLAEGVETAAALVARGTRHSVELPVAETIADILAGRIAPDAAVPRLMLRPHRSE